MSSERLACLAVAFVFSVGLLPAAAAEGFVAKKNRYMAAKVSSKLDVDKVANADKADHVAKAAKADKAKKRWQAKLRKRIGKRPAKLINIYNGHTEEILPVLAAKRAKLDIPQSMINNFLRCHFTNQPTDFDAKTFATMVKAAKHFRAKRVVVISGFRAWKYNLSLIKKGREVSRKSQHVKGKAVDFALPGISVKRLRSWCINQRLGGVGVYPHSGFVHVDSGRVRYWSGR